MATLLKVAFLTQGRRCITQANNTTCLLNKMKPDFTNSQILSCIQVANRGVSTQSDKAEKLLVYKGMLASHVRGIKVFSLVTSLIGISGWPYVYLSNSYIINGTPVTGAMLGALAAYSLSSPLLIHYLTKRYLTKIEYDADDDKYIATVYTLLARAKKIEFKLEDVTRPELPKMFTSIYVKGVPLFFDPYSFDEPEHCRRLLAYDQPIDFKMNQIVEEEIEEKPVERIKQESKI